MAKTADIHWQAIRPVPLTPPRPPPEILRDAFEASTGLHDFLRAAAARDEPILLVVNDPHRATQTRAALAALAEVPRQGAPRFRALVATGTHRFSTDERSAFERQTFVACGLNIDAIAWHDATDESTLVPLAAGRVHRWLAESRFLLPIGSVEPHYFAGVTGAHKTVTIGCLSRADIERSHAGALSPDSDVCRLHGNPVFDDMVTRLDALQAAGKHICAINEVICGGSLLAAAAGDPLQTLDTLLPTACEVFTRVIDQPADILHLRVPLPLGRNLYQADKALKNNQRAVRDGGGIILDAECPEGVGPAAFMNLLRRAPDYAAAQRIVVRDGYQLGDHKAVKLRHLTDPAARGVRVALVSTHIADADAAVADMRVFGDVSAALAWLRDVLRGPLQRGLVIEDAGHVSVQPAGLSAADRASPRAADPVLGG